MAKKLIFAVFGLSLILAGCAAQTTAPINAQNQKANNANTIIGENPGQAQSDGQITIQNFAFQPQSITIKAGGKAIWINKDSAPHTIKGQNFNSPILSVNNTFEHQFNQPGTYNYSCSIHPSMTGTIIVQ